MQGINLRAIPIFASILITSCLAASVEAPPEGVGTKIESPNGTFFVEELPAPTKNEAGETIDDQEVWIVSAKDPTELRRIFYTVTPKYWKGSGALFLWISGEWETSSGQFVGCEQNLTIAFDRVGFGEM